MRCALLVRESSVGGCDYPIKACDRGHFRSCKQAEFSVDFTAGTAILALRDWHSDVPITIKCNSIPLGLTTRFAIFPVRSVRPDCAPGRFGRKPRIQLLNGVPPRAKDRPKQATRICEGHETVSLTRAPFRAGFWKWAPLSWREGLRRRRDGGQNPCCRRHA